MKMPRYVPIRVSAKCPSQTRTEITARKHSMVIDEPPERHGKEAGMLPLEALMASFAGCTNTIVNWTARDIGIELKDIFIDITGTLDTNTVTGLAPADPPFPEVKLKIELTTSATPEQMVALQEDLRWRCPVSATLRGSGGKINEDWTIHYA